jgi:hypothetical protein
MPIPCWFVESFAVSAVLVSILHGCFCFEVHGLKRSDFSWPSLIQQGWFNFVGSLFGWAALWCLVRRAWSVWGVSSSSGQATISDFGLGFVAFVGISGYLPYTTMGAVDAIRAFIAEALKRLLDLATKAKSED